MLVLDLARGRILDELDGFSGAWLSDTEVVAVDDTGHRVELHRRGADEWVSAVVRQSEQEGPLLSLVPDSSGEIALFEHGSDDDRLLVASPTPTGLDWRTHTTSLERAPSVVHLDRNVGVNVRQRSIDLLRLDTGELLSRFEGASSYSRAALSPDGLRLAFIAHAEPSPEQVSQEGRPELHVYAVTGTEHWVWGRAPLSHRSLPTSNEGSGPPIGSGLPGLTDRLKPLPDQVKVVLGVRKHRRRTRETSHRYRSTSKRT